MVKRHNKTGRRQILQLVDKKPPPPTVAANSHKPQVSRGLTYYSDSDEEGESEAPVPSASEANSGPIDSQVADFLKEIDALSATNNSEAASSEADSKPTDIDDHDESGFKQTANILKKTENTDSNSDAINGESTSKQDPAEVYCVWQQCHDENSGYSYFWNVMTNEVTWDCPPEYLAYQKYLNAHAAQSSIPSTSTKPKSVSKKTQKKNEAILKEGAIIPISYFGGSSSSESSDEADSQNSPSSPKTSAFIQKASTSQASSLLNNKHKNQVKNKLSKKGSAETMGPQLPPNFQFPEDVPLSPFQLNADGSVCEHSDVSSAFIGPQLPSGYIPEDALQQDVDSNVQIENLTSENQCSSSQSSNNAPVVDSSGSEDKLKDTVLTGKLIRELDKNPIQDEDTSNSGDVPDSTTKKETAPPKLNDDSMEVSAVMGYRPVVEYDSFSDTEEEMDTACSSSSKHHVSKAKACIESINSSVPATESPDTQHLSPKENLSADVMELECSTSSEVASKSSGECSNNVCSMNSQIDTSEGVGNDIEDDVVALCNSESENLQSEEEEVIQHKKSYDSDIVSNMFSFAKETSGKFGFGFSKSKQLELENEAFSMAEQSSGSHKKHAKGYPIISFVKSKQVLDLNVLNDSHMYQGNEPVEKEKSSVKVEPCAVPCSSKMAEINGVNNELNTNAQEPLVSGLSEKTDTEKQTGDTTEKSATNPVVVEGHAVIAAQKLDDSKKGKMKKKHANKAKKETKEGAKAVPITNLDSSTSDAQTGVDDIDQLLGSILKEMVESGESSSQVSATSQKQPQETKKRHQSMSQPGSFKKKKKAEEAKEVEDKGDGVMTHIIDLATVVMEKMTFLVTNNSSMVSLSSVLVQIQTRLVDWQAGALDSKYFMDRLQEVQQYLHHYEMSIVTGDWTCQWDRENKRYFYVNERTQHSQWTYPSEAVTQSAMHNKAMWGNHSSEIAVTSNKNFQASGTQFPLVSSSMSEEQVHKANIGPPAAFMVPNEECDHDGTERGPRSNSSWLRQRAREASPPPPPPGVDTPPPPPPPPVTPPPENPPPPPPDSTEVKCGGIPDVDMDLEDSNSSDSALFTRNIIVKGSVDESQQARPIPVKHFFSECSSTKSPEQQSTAFSMSVVSSTSASHSESAVIAKPPQPVTLSSGNSAFSAAPGVNIQPTWAMSSSVPSCSSAQTSYLPASNEIAAPPVGMPSSQKFMNDEIVTSSPSQECSSPTHSSNLSSNKSAVSTNNNSVSANKKEKKKPKLRTGLSFKKKNIPSLVQKWQKIKEEQEKEDKNSDDPKLSMPK